MEETYLYSKAELLEELDVETSPLEHSEEKHLKLILVNEHLQQSKRVIPMLRKRLMKKTNGGDILTRVTKITLQD